MEYGKPRRVKLKDDLTKYDERCTIGQLGKTIPLYKFGVWGSFDHFVAVKFDNGAGLDVAFSSLEIIEE